MNNKPALLLHCCCAPCSVSVSQGLQEKYEVTCFFFNPNINEEQEYIKRKDEMIKLADKLKLPLIIGKYPVKEWLEAVRGLENEPEGGARCRKCFEFRLKQTAGVAGEKGFELFATTLTVAPMKNHEIINEIGNRVKENVEYLESDFKKKDGYKKSVELSKRFNLYRQNYCGCTFSRKKK
ncbi:MAG: epoxyqueuosine reductase QueH [Vulcanimicrobiota bacterium]